MRNAMPVWDAGMSRIFTVVLVIAALMLVCVFPVSCGSSEKEGILKIGVMMPLSGDRPLEWEKILDWQKELLNDELRDTGMEIELEYEDTFGEDVADLAREYARDPSIKVVIGPETSREAMQVIPEFIKTRTLLISPSATSDVIFRAFRGSGFFARTCQSDVAQTKAIFTILKQEGVKRFSLLYEDTSYGKTYFDWAGFFAREMGLEMLGSASFAPGQEDVSGPVNQALEGDPQCVIAAAFPRDAATIDKCMERSGSSAELFITDAGVSHSFIAEAGEAAEGVEGIAPSQDPGSGFTELYKEEFGEVPSAWAASLYDSLLLALYTSARNRVHGEKEEVDESFKEVVGGTGTKYGCDPSQAAAAVKEIQGGGNPDVQGATGNLTYNRLVGIDPLQTFYCHWKVSDSELEQVSVLDSEKLDPAGVLEPGEPVSMTRASPELMGIDYEVKTDVDTEQPGGELWAVVVGTRSGLPEYQHQADALSIYRLLKQNGVSDDHIILMLPDDIAEDAGNMYRGTVINGEGGKDMRAHAVIDYSGEDVTARNLTRVLSGEDDGGLPVLGSDNDSDVLVYISGDGKDGDISFDQSKPIPAGRLGSSTRRMHQKGLYGRLLYLLEMDDGDEAARDLDSPGALFIAGTRSNESSTSANYDSNLGEWLANQFTYETVVCINSGSSSIAAYFENVYGEIDGAHACILNQAEFGNIFNTNIMTFFSP